MTIAADGLDCLGPWTDLVLIVWKWWVLGCDFSLKSAKGQDGGVKKDPGPCSLSQPKWVDFQDLGPGAPF